LLKTLHQTAEQLRSDEIVYRVRVRPDRAFEYVSPSVERILGRTPKDFYADPDIAQRLVVADDRPLVKDLVDDPRERPGPLCLRWRHADGAIVWTEVLRVPVCDEKGRIVAVEGVLRDITWRKDLETQHRGMEQRLRESRRRLRELSAHAERSREEERRAMARTLHDELGQVFSSIRLELGAAIAEFRQCAAPEMRPVVDRLQAAAGLTDIGVASLRQLTTALRPPILDHLGLLPAIRWEASIFSKRTGLRCYVRARPATVTFRDAQVTALYRILLAALDNIARHAAAGTVWIQLTRQRGVTLMEVRDNGRGITDEQVNNPRTMGCWACASARLRSAGKCGSRGGGATARGSW